MIILFTLEHMEIEMQEIELIKIGEMISLLNEEIKDTLQEVFDFIKDFNVDAKLLEKLANGMDLTNRTVFRY
jgi:hypothetical protein